MRSRRFSSFDFIIMITIIGIITTVLFITTSGNSEVVQKKKRLTPQQRRDVRGAEIAGLAYNNYPSSDDTCKVEGLDEILVVRVPGTPANRAVRDYLVKRVERLGWTVELDTFTQNTIIGEKEFSNVIGYSNPGAKKHVVITAHYDSKIMDPVDNKYFLGAVDSAVPCAMILSMMDNLNKLLLKRQQTDPDRGIIVVFFDGEEAFKEWTKTDSIYGSTHLAEKWKNEGFFEKMELFVLLDLIGAKNPRFLSSFSSTQHHFQRMFQLEKELQGLGLFTDKSKEDKMYFKEKGSSWGIEDDHKPFENRGFLDIVHLISTPFPPQWHKLTDDGDHLDCPTIHNLMKIFQLWIAELFNLHKLINM